MTNDKDPDHADFKFLRYHDPEMIKQIRLGLDLGAHPLTYERLFRKAMRKAANDPDTQKAGEISLAALHYMQRNPLAGVARFTEGEQYVWVEDDAEENSTEKI